MEKAKTARKARKFPSKPRVARKKAEKPKASAPRRAPVGRTRKAAPASKSARAVRSPARKLSLGSFMNTGALGGVMLVVASLWTVTKKREEPQAPAPRAVELRAADITPAQSQPPAPVQPPAEVAEVAQAAPPAATAAPQAPSSRIAREFAAVAGLPLDERVARWSRFLLDNPDPRRALRDLGAPPVVADSAPLLPARFDCTTYVETVLALARSAEPSAFFEQLIAIRYKGARPGYLSRNHFPEADWIPNNARAGLIVDVTENVARESGFEADFASKKIDRGAWLAARKLSGGAQRSIASVAPEELERWSAPVDVRLGYIPSARVRSGAISIPNGLVVNFIHQLDGRKPVLITHQGFVVKEGEKLLLRHASPGGHVQTVKLEDYLRGNARIIGINLNQPAQ